MRKFHRWIMTVFGLLVAYWVVTGLWLAIVDVTDAQRGWSNDGGGPGSSTPKVVGGLVIATAGSLSAVEVNAMTLTTIQAARAIDPSTAIAAMELSAPNGVPLGAITFAGATPRRLVFNAKTGELIDGDASAAPPGNDPGDSLHSSVKNWHRGTVGAEDNYTRAPGNLLAFAAGATLFLLSLTGIFVYLDLWRRRRKAGQASLFWS